MHDAAPMQPPSLSSRAAIVMSGAALLMSVGFAGAPVVARAIVKNSDRVDGLHAVRAGATTEARRGKLVATDRVTGAFRPNVIPPEVTFPSRVPDDVTLRGAWSFESQATGGQGDYGSTIDLRTQLPTEPLVELVGEDEAPTQNCPGSSELPEAAKGYLCMYVIASEGFDIDTAAYGSTRYGIFWHFQTTDAVTPGSDLYIRGTYAVTAGKAL